MLYLYFLIAALLISGVSGLRPTWGIYIFKNYSKLTPKNSANFIFENLKSLCLKNSPDQDRTNKKNIQIYPSVPDEIGFKHTNIGTWVYRSCRYSKIYILCIHICKYRSINKRECVWRKGAEGFKNWKKGLGYVSIVLWHSYNSKWGN